MKAFKKLAAVLLALGMVAGFAACGGGKDEDESNGSAVTSESGKDEDESNGSAVTSESGTGETKGEEVDATQMEAAVQAVYNATNLTLKMTGVEKADNKTYDVSYTCMYADGKAYGEYVRVYEGRTETQYTYFGKADDVWCRWDSIDGQFWDVEKNLAEGEACVIPGTELQDFFKYIDFYGGYMDFDEKTGMYSFSTLGNQSVAVKVVGGKIVNFIYEEGQDLHYDGELIYGNTTIGELPSAN